MATLASALPTGQRLAVCLNLFLSAMASVATRRAGEAGPAWITHMAPRYLNALHEYLDGQALEVALQDFDERDAAALTGLQVEMVYYARCYAPDLFATLNESDLQEIQPVSSIVGSPPPMDPFVRAAVDDADTIRGSLDFLLDKLPWWLRRVVDVILQAIKMAHGG